MPDIKFADIQADPRLQNLTYLYVIHGTIPELMPSVAYRRVGPAEQYKRKIVKCPFCTSRITDADADTKVELYGHTNRVTVKCQIYLRCNVCHHEIGMIVA